MGRASADVRPGYLCDALVPACDAAHAMEPLSAAREQDIVRFIVDGGSSRYPERIIYLTRTGMMSPLKKQLSPSFCFIILCLHRFSSSVQGSVLVPLVRRRRAGIPI